MDSVSRSPMYRAADFTVEEINLMCVYDTTDRYILIDEMEESLPYIIDPEMLALMQTTLDKLYATSDQHFAEIPFFPADDMEDGDDETELI